MRWSEGAGPGDNRREWASKRAFREYTLGSGMDRR